MEIDTNELLVEAFDLIIDEGDHKEAPQEVYVNVEYQW